MMKITIIIAVASISALCAGCANCDSSYEFKSVEYFNDAEHRVAKETTATLKKNDFSQGWSNGSGKTVDVHPEVSLINGI